MNGTNLQFDKLLLTALVLIFAGLAFRGFHLGNADLSTFSSDNCKLFSGALLTLITGARLQQRNGDSKNGGSNVPDKTVPSNNSVVPLNPGK